MIKKFEKSNTMVKKALKNQKKCLDSYYYYFFLKSGPRNCFLKFAGKNHLGGFWIGYQNHNDLLKNLGLRHFYQYQNGKVIFPGLKDWRSPDYYLLCMASSPAWRDKVRICTYGTDELEIWEFEDSLRPISNNGANILRDEFQRQYRKNQAALDESHFVPARLLYKIPRSQLIAPVDSLSVFQYLNRGTFRPMFNIRSKVQMPMLRNLGSCLNPIEIEYNKNNKTSVTTLSESDYGKFLRLYLEGMIRKICLNTKKHIGTSLFTCITMPNRIKLIASILNPAQVETLAFLLVEDLGITADVALGKGLDVVDVKGTWRHKACMRNNLSNSISKELKNLNVRISTKLSKKINDDFVLPIQCKASSDKSVVAGILGILPIHTQAGSPMPEDKIGIVELMEYAWNNPKIFPKIYDWINLLMHDLFQ